MSRNHRPLHARRWTAVRRAIFGRDGYRCRSCGLAGRLECDHVTPLHRGGDAWDFSNLQTLCRDCHIKKTARENERPDSARAKWRRMTADLMDEYED